MELYDKETLKQIHIWKNPEVSFVSKCVASISKPIDRAGEFVMSAPYVGEAIAKATSGLVEVLTDASAYTVRQSKIIDDFKGAGHNVTDLNQIKHLKLEEIDKVVGFLGAKYKGLALTEGAAAGGASTLNPVAGALAIAVDIPLVTGLCLRAIGEYATHYGFDINKQEERMFMLNILFYSSSSSDVAKQAALANLTKIAVDVAKKKTWDELNKNVFVKLVSKLAESLGIRLTKAKLAQILPAISIAIGAGYNTYLISDVCETAYMLYRERFLAEYYDNPDIIDVVVAPADEITFDVKE